MNAKIKILIVGLLLCTPISEFNVQSMENTQESIVVSEWITHPSIIGGSIKFDRSTGKITDIDPSVTILNIPERIDNILVTGIADYAFHQHPELTSVTIPDTILSIGQSAFADCKKLMDVILSTGLKSIEQEAFANCVNLLDLEIPSTVEYIGVHSFANCVNLKEMIIPASVKTIGNNAFSNCDNLLEVAISHGVMSIGDGVFHGCDKLELVSIPTSILSLGKNIFPDNLKMIYYEGVREQWSTLESDITKSAIIYNSQSSLFGKWIEVEGIEGGKIQFDAETGVILNAQSTIIVAEIPDYINGVAVSAIGKNAFANCDQLTRLRLPETLVMISEYAFYSCDSLRTVTIPENVVTIKYNAFGYNPSLETMNISSGVQFMDSMVFVYNTKLRNIYYEGSQDEWNQLKIPAIKNVMIIYDGFNNEEFWYTASDLPGLESGRIMFDKLTGTIMKAEGVSIVNIPPEIDGVRVTSISDDAFRQLKTLTHITLPDTITFIGNWAFSDCINLKEIIFSKMLTSIGDNAFLNCSSLSKLTIPQNVQSIGNSAFFGCSNLESATILDGTKTIGDLAFFGCSNMTSIILPKTVTDIGQNAFDATNSLTIIYFGGTDQEWDNLNVNISDNITVL
ncbi:MAG: hypothetical protein ATN31_08500 [Candidatus Epulonipiscioides saccharophilum]|nr:MAG: hypothetical protein ATN31_08500 [Epulopiscium sp. AS2M-Bin001]